MSGVYDCAGGYSSAPSSAVSVIPPRKEEAAHGVWGWRCARQGCGHRARGEVARCKATMRPSPIHTSLGRAGREHLARGGRPGLARGGRCRPGTLLPVFACIVALHDCEYTLDQIR
jgi:hypothetical protein